ncbi:MAG: hypothetical protein Q4G69_14445 [Planctomycetia bacterium]|nr:hypothetical protein [Planctomycetia bacterium]
MAERSPAEKFYIKLGLISLIILLVGAGLIMGSVYGAEQLKGIVGEQGTNILRTIGALGTLGGLISFLLAAKKLMDNHMS